MRLDDIELFAVDDCANLSRKTLESVYCVLPNRSLTCSAHHLLSLTTVSSQSASVACPWSVRLQMAQTGGGLQAVDAWQQVPGHDLRFRGCLIEPMRCVFRRSDHWMACAGTNKSSSPTAISLFSSINRTSTALECQWKDSLSFSPSNDMGPEDA